MGKQVAFPANIKLRSRFGIIRARMRNDRVFQSAYMEESLAARSDGGPRGLQPRRPAWRTSTTSNSSTMLGHVAGDEVLGGRSIPGVAVRGEDVACRYGGEDSC